MGILKGVQPEKVFALFEEMCAIPHGSGNTKAISDWCVAFAKERGLEHYQDADNNIIIIKEATPGYEQAEPVILQGHLDMVCEKLPDCTKDMAKEGLELVVDEEYVSAKGTTLGGDDGIAVAMAMAVLDDHTLQHPRIEAVFTVDEEIGLLGAASIDVSPLKGHTMINIDSELEGVFTVSCAGGNTSTCTLPVERAAFAGQGFSLVVGGLTGGHSGTEIDKRRANSNMLMGRVLRALDSQGQMRLIRVEGGLKDNAIPVETRAFGVVQDTVQVQAVAAEMEKILRNEYQTTDPNLFVKAELCTQSQIPMTQESSEKVLCMLTCLPNGIQAMSAEIAGLVQTSLNMGILKTEEGNVMASYSVRSSVDSQKQMLKDQLLCLMTQLGGTVQFKGEYAGWQYQENSPLRERMVSVFVEQYGHEPKIEAIHAGLECGVFAGKIPGLDCISIGPDLFEIHTPREKMSIASVQRVYRFLVEVLKRSK